MSHRYTEEEMLTCEKCGKSYIPKYKECPYCRAGKIAAYSNPKRRVKSVGERFLAVVLTLGVLAGAGAIGYNMILNDQWVIGREHAAVEETGTTNQVTSEVTEEDVVLTESAEETEETKTDTQEEAEATETPTVLG